jgi:hypothetical protein
MTLGEFCEVERYATHVDGENVFVCTEPEPGVAPDTF